MELISKATGFAVDRTPKRKPEKEGVLIFRFLTRQIAQQSSP